MDTKMSILLFFINLTRNWGKRYSKNKRFTGSIIENNVRQKEFYKHADYLPSLFTSSHIILYAPLMFREYFKLLNWLAN